MLRAVEAPQNRRRDDAVHRGPCYTCP